MYSLEEYLLQVGSWYRTHYLPVLVYSLEEDLVQGGSWYRTHYLPVLVYSLEEDLVQGGSRCPAADYTEVMLVDVQVVKQGHKVPCLVLGEQVGCLRIDVGLQFSSRDHFLNLQSQIQYIAIGLFLNDHVVASAWGKKHIDVVSTV